MAIRAYVRYDPRERETADMSSEPEDDRAGTLGWRRFAVPTPDELIDHLVERQATMECNYVQVLGPGQDSGWLLVGENPHESAKYQARRNHAGGEGFYFVAKRDRADPALRTADTARPILGHPAPMPVWHRQKPWQDNFPLPEDLWSHPAEDAARTRPYPSRDEIRTQIASRAIESLSKGPDAGARSLETAFFRSHIKGPGR
jgi:hypothetical protein